MIDAPNPEHCKKTKLTKGYWEAKSKPHWVEIATLIIVGVVGLFQICIYFKQANIMQTQANIAADANKQTAAANRAFVYSQDINFAGPNTGMTNGADWVAILNWQNSGNTPTRDLEIAVTYTGYPTVQKFPVFPSFKDIEHRPTFMGPKATGVITLPFTAEVLSAIQQHTLNVYIFGRATYHDVIDPKENRVTRICRELSNVPPSFSQPKAQTFFADCAIHNCADEECAREDREHPEAAPKE
jgi:hypothetical protein